MKGNLIGIDADPAKIKMGMPVEVVYKDALGRKDREGNSYLTYFFEPPALAGGSRRHHERRLRRRHRHDQVQKAGTGPAVAALGAQAALMALDDCGLKIQDMEALYCGNLGQAERRWSASASCSRSARPASRW